MLNSLSDTTAADEAAAVARLAERFPKLRRSCDSHDDMEIALGPDVECPECNGREWLPATPAEALYWLMGREECLGVEHRHASPDPEWFEANWLNMPGSGPTPLLAVAAAIESAEEGV